jgi:hypothetical protein
VVSFRGRESEQVFFYRLFLSLLPLETPHVQLASPSDVTVHVPLFKHGPGVHGLSVEIKNIIKQC